MQKTLIKLLFMKKTIMLLCMALATGVSYAQSAAELAKQQQELNAIHMKIINAAPSKSAKKEAKAYKKEGWMVPAGESGIEQQITSSQLYGAELMADAEGNATKRFIMQTAQQVSGTYNAGYAAARAAAQQEVAAMLKTRLVTLMEGQRNNNQLNAVDAATNSEIGQKFMLHVEQTLTNGIPVLAIYRRLPNNNFEVQVRIAYDKKQMASRMKMSLRKEMSREGDALADMVDGVLADE